MKRKIKHPRLDPNKNRELKHLAALVGDFIEYWGFKAVQGRMWCFLFMVKEPLDSRQLAQLLQISPALVTQSVQVLLKYQVIREVEKGKNGVLRFSTNPNISEVIAGVLSQREQVLLEKIQIAHTQLAECDMPQDSAVAADPARVEQVGKWIALAKLMLETGVHSLNQKPGPFEVPADFRFPEINS
jgi:DNA-binding transcriptional regulator GbsR (MarR family)